MGRWNSSDLGTQPALTAFGRWSTKSGHYGDGKTLKHILHRSELEKAFSFCFIGEIGDHLIVCCAIVF